MDYVPVYDDEAGTARRRRPGHAAFTLSAERQQLIGVTREPRRAPRARGRDPRRRARRLRPRALPGDRRVPRSGPLARRRSAPARSHEAHAGARRPRRAARACGSASAARRGAARARSRRAAAIPPSCCCRARRVWVYAQVYEYEVDLVQPGQTMVGHGAVAPGRDVHGERRRRRPDPRPDDADGARPRPRRDAGGDLRPETFVDVTSTCRSASSSPCREDAVLDTGEHQIVFVVRGDGPLRAARRRRSGARRRATTRCSSGLAAGEQVVTSANFLIDSESRFRAALAAFGRPRGRRHAALRTRDGRAHHRVQRAEPLPRAAPRPASRSLGARRGRCGTSRSTRSPTSPTRRSSSTRAGTAAPTSSRTRSPIRSSTALLGAPKVKAIRGFSDFGYSYVYVIFQDGTDLYWARSRVLEYLSKILPRLPEGVRTEIGPGRDQRRLGLPVRARRPLRDARPRRAAQPPGLVPALPPAVGPRRRRGRGGRRLREAVPGERRPEPAARLRRPAAAARRRRPQGQQRGRRPAPRVRRHRVHGARPRLRALDSTTSRTSSSRSTRRPARRSSSSTSRRSTLGPDIRRGVADLDGQGDTVGGIVVMRQGENALARHRAREGTARRARADAARGRRGRHDLRPLDADPARDRHAACTRSARRC